MQSKRTLHHHARVMVYVVNDFPGNMSSNWTTVCEMWSAWCRTFMSTLEHPHNSGLLMLHWHWCLIQRRLSVRCSLQKNPNTTLYFDTICLVLYSPVLVIHMKDHIMQDDVRWLQVGVVSTSSSSTRSRDISQVRSDAVSYAYRHLNRLEHALYCWIRSSYCAATGMLRSKEIRLHKLFRVCEMNYDSAANDHVNIR